MTKIHKCPQRPVTSLFLVRFPFDFITGMFPFLAVFYLCVLQRCPLSEESMSGLLVGATKRKKDPQKYQQHILVTCSKLNTHKLTCECCAHRNSITEQRLFAASCLLNHIQKKISSSVQERKVLNSPSFLLSVDDITLSDITGSICYMSNRYCDYLALT